MYVIVKIIKLSNDNFWERLIFYRIIIIKKKMLINGMKHIQYVKYYKNEMKKKIKIKRILKQLIKY